MPFVKRDSNGRICGLYDDQIEIGLDFLLPDDPEVVAFQEIQPEEDMLPEESLEDEDDSETEDEDDITYSGDFQTPPLMPLAPSQPPSSLEEPDDDAQYDDLEESGDSGSQDPISVRKRDLGESDFALIRAIEDLITLLDKKGVISENELPPPVQNLLERRRSIRKMVQEIHNSGLTDGL